MRLRNRQYGPGKTFYPFKRLPTELRQMIWRLTLEPRIVEVLCTEGDFYCGNLDNSEPHTHDEPRGDIGEGYDGENCHTDEGKFCSLAQLPAALRVCHDSRNAVIIFYPHAFGGKSGRSKVRFNFALDTLYLDEMCDACTLRLLQDVSETELSRLKSIAIFETSGYGHDGRYFDSPDKWWSSVKSAIERFLNHEEIVIVRDVFSEAVRRLNSFWCLRKQMEFFEEFPNEALQNLEVYGWDVLSNPVDIPIDWVSPKMKVVWGWRRTDYPSPD